MHALLCLCCCHICVCVPLLLCVLCFCPRLPTSQALRMCWQTCWSTSSRSPRAHWAVSLTLAQSSTPWPARRTWRVRGNRDSQSRGLL